MIKKKTMLNIFHYQPGIDKLFDYFNKILN